MKLNPFKGALIMDENKNLQAKIVKVGMWHKFDAKGKHK